MSRLSLAQVAERLGVSTVLAGRLVRSGQLNGIVVSGTPGGNGRVTVSEEDLAAYIATASTRQSKATKRTGRRNMPVARVPQEPNWAALDQRSSRSTKASREA